MSDLIQFQFECGLCGLAELKNSKSPEFHEFEGFSSVWVTKWQPFWERAAHSDDHMFSLYFDYL